jgi:acid phosphatase (class A)
MKRTMALAAVVFTLVAAMTAPPEDSRLIPAAAVDPVALLPAPPAEDSAEAREELATLLRLTGARTAADEARARSTETLTVFALADVIGPGFSAVTCPKTAALFAQLEAESKEFTRPTKSSFARRRPPFVDPRVKPCVKLEDEGSYPSGHATRAMLFADVLGAALPEQREALARRAREIGFDRVVGGVHYPSDVVAGRVLGRALARATLGAPATRQRLADLAGELAAARAGAEKTAAAK